MFVKELDLLNFRNYEKLSIEPAEGVNIFYGDNAQGKTNILEAVFLAGTSKSHRGAKDRSMIRLSENESHIRMILDRLGNEYRVDMHLKKNASKGIAINGVPVKRAAELFSIASFVFFSPEDLRIIKMGPSVRRQFLDLMISSIDPLYLNDLLQFNKIIDQRNALLHEAAFDEKRLSELDIWDMQLVLTGKKIISGRKKFIEEFSLICADRHAELTSGNEKLKLIYEPNTSEEELEEKLKRLRSYDLKTKMTNAGPHRDDLGIEANGMDLRTFGSQGQQRTAALSMKLAQIDVITKERHQKPVLLLDDVLSELDGSRQEALLKAIRGTQTWITCTGVEDFLKTGFQAERLYHVKAGTVEIET